MDKKTAVSRSAGVKALKKNSIVVDLVGLVEEIID